MDLWMESKHFNQFIFLAPISKRQIWCVCMVYASVWYLCGPGPGPGVSLFTIQQTAAQPLHCCLQMGKYYPGVQTH